MTQLLLKAIDRTRQLGHLLLSQIDPQYNFRLIPLSPLGNLWAVRRKGTGPWALIQLRFGTEDLNIFFQIFISEDYRLSKLTRRGELSQKYASITRAGKSPLILDCGANIGLSSLYFHWMYPDALILAVEPEAGNFRRLTGNIRKAKGKIIAVNAAVSHKEGFVRILDEKAGTSCFQVGETSQRNSTGSLPAKTISSLVRQAGSPGQVVPFIVKFDIEGYEKQVFSANTGWIDSFPILIIELHDWKFPGEMNSHHFLGAISKKKRDFVYIGENIFSLKN